MSVRRAVVDGGGTKCHWLVFGRGGECDFVTPGVNPLMLSASQIVETWASAVADAGVGCVDEVYYYGAGCIGGEANEKIADALRHLTHCGHVVVESDILGAARATLGREAGVACILGTGCNSCLYDGRAIVANVRPLGYILGDEGSGADIGKHIVADALKGLLDRRTTEAFFAFAGGDYAEIVRRVYSQPRANAYLATFAQFAAERSADPAVEAIVQERLRAFLRRNVLLYPAEGLSAGVSFVGGVASHFEASLRCVCGEFGVGVRAVCADPVGGLRRYHEQPVIAP